MKYTSLALLFLFLAACKSTQNISYEEKANALAHKFIITDGHVDVPYRLKDQLQRQLPMDDVSERTEGGDFDFVRAKAGGLDAPFMSIYVPAVYQRTGGAKKYADGLIDMVNGIADKHPEKFEIATSPDQVEAIVKKGKIALPMGMENGAPIEMDLANVAHFHKRGIRYITLTHSEDNKICDSSYDTTHTYNGLSPFGREVIQEMNKVGIMVDVSHISDSSFYQVMALSKAPVIASHSSCRYFTPGFERNMNDDMIKLLAKNGGVIQINFGGDFLDTTYRKSSNVIRDSVIKFMMDNSKEYGSPETQDLIKELGKVYTLAYPSLEVVANHIDHVVKLVGPDYVAFGSDFDGVGDSLPIGLKDVSQYPNLIAALLKRGYSEQDIEKICYKNVFRVWRQVEKVAADMQKGK
jgi:membrane dipeptidase